MADDLEIPAFLRAAARQPKPKARRHRWTRLKAQRPEGAKWEAAERWQVTIPDTREESCGDIPPGARLVWVIAGARWVELRDAEAYAKIPAQLWAKMARAGRLVDQAK